jgi:acetolactate synthase-1/3 small subunit
MTPPLPGAKDVAPPTKATPRVQQTRIFIAHVEDRPGVLNRIASLFRRRAFNIVSLTVGRTHDPGVSKLTVVVDADDDTARRIEANLYKLVNVLEVHDVSNQPAVARELALIKVQADGATRREVLELVEVFRARVVDVSRDTLVVEITGTHDKVDGLVEVLRPYGIIEMVRTGVVAMTRGPAAALSGRPNASAGDVSGTQTEENHEETDPWHESSTTATPISA